MTTASDGAVAGDAGVPVAAALFRCLGDPSRLAILRHLLLGEHRVVDLTRHMSLAQSTVSQHVACLRDCGLVVARPQGRATVLSVAHPADVLALLAATEALLGHGGDAVALCPVRPAFGVGPDARAGGEGAA
ncbi:metalloregulator ArsR/SmtB family transcription factor [Cellulomonas sp. JZ18]|uniref:ArsR/SmtB family transcription factor n=1 Tax=Cellulomonas sp. JZ18 TaxID=2654191 RepID=UPI0012D4863D|nr:metalloregulator ArsR/SmtB family transcription factor [Cellulomonas sp. JZ18]QGQ18161.1 metalloregulator ArsR/SmtB family transcription factor [Cellulomonas sp. JZ18]